MIVVYDVGVERVNKVRELLRTYLVWMQNSVFEGELTESELLRVMAALKKLIDRERDSVLIYKLRDEKYLDRAEMGTTKGERSTIL